jgi:2,3,4,5-tetrahydropyridine-2-carboxylate N-succinyltransferase
MDIRNLIEKTWEDRTLLTSKDSISAIESVINQLDKGQLRVAEPTSNGWQVNDWVKKAVILYFPTRKMETMEAGPMEFHDKMALKRNYSELGVRVVPHAIATIWRLPRQRSDYDALLCKHWSLC